MLGIVAADLAVGDVRLDHVAGLAVLGQRGLGGCGEEHLRALAAGQAPGLERLASLRHRQRRRVRFERRLLGLRASI